MRKTDDGMNIRQRRFVENYLLDPNGTQAAIRAGYSERTARVQATKLLTIPAIRRELLSREKRREEVVGIDAAWLLNRLALMAAVEISDLFDSAGNLLPPSSFPSGAQALVSSIDVFEQIDKDGNITGRTRRVRFESRTKVLELIGKHFQIGAWRENITIDDRNDRVERIRRAQRRAGHRC